MYFFFQAEDGIRDADVTGVQTCALPISTVAIYNQASHLEKIGEFDEARRLFQLVRQRPDEEYWVGAEYHLGCIETELGNPAAAHAHFMECPLRNPGHSQARRMVNHPTLYREVDPNVFEIIESGLTTRVLFILFGELSNIVN